MSMMTELFKEMEMTEGSRVDFTLAPEDEAAIRAIVAGMEAKWNAGDAAGYAAYFAEEADFINIRGEHVRGEAVIAAGHREIFDTIYRDSRNCGTVEQIRPLRGDVALVHVRWRLRFRIAGDEVERRARATLVLTREATGWQIAAFQNTTVETGGPPAGAARG